MKRIHTLFIGAAVLTGCELTDSADDAAGDIPSGAFTTTDIGHQGLSYVWDDSVIPEITFKVSQDEWNRLLGLYDQNHNTK